jgi:hypothetical protein
MMHLQFSDAVSIFMKLVVKHAYLGAINIMTKLLTQGPSGRLKPQDRLRLHQWYMSLDSKGQAMVSEIIEESVKVSVFNFLVFLDNKTVGNPIQKQFSDFAVYLQSYSSEDTRIQNTPVETIRINQSYEASGELHELLNETITNVLNEPRQF